MTKFVLSAEADEDLQEIFLYSVREWDEHQAERYLSGLFEAFALIADTPAIGR